MPRPLLRSSWKRPVPLDWRSILTMVRESTTYHGTRNQFQGIPYQQFMRTGGPTHLTQVNIAQTALRLRLELDSQLVRTQADPKDIVEFEAMCVVGDDIDSVAEARRVWKRGKEDRSSWEYERRRALHPKSARAVSHLDQLIRDLIDKMQECAEGRVSPPGNAWLVSITFTVRKTQSYLRGLQHLEYLEV